MKTLHYNYLYFLRKCWTKSIYLIQLDNVSQTSSKRFVETPPICPVWCLSYLGPSINGLVTDGNTKLCCRGFILAGFILALFQSSTANKIDSEHTHDYKWLLSVCEAEILRVTVKRIEVFSSFYVDF